MHFHSMTQTQMHGGHMVGNMYITKWLHLVLRIPYTELQIH